MLINCISANVCNYYYFTSAFTAILSSQLIATSLAECSLCRPTSLGLLTGHSFTICDTVWTISICTFHRMPGPTCVYLQHRDPGWHRMVQCTSRLDCRVCHKWLVDHYRHYTHTHTRLMALFSGTTQLSRYQKSKTNLDFTEARDSEWQWHQLGHMQVSTLLQTDNHTSTPPL